RERGTARSTTVRLARSRRRRWPTRSSAPRLKQPPRAGCPRHAISVRSRRDLRDSLRSAVRGPRSAVTVGGSQLNRRDFLRLGAAVPTAALLRAQNSPPGVPCGVAAGDVSGGRAVIWSRSDRPARMFVEYSTTQSFTAVQ